MPYNSFTSTTTIANNQHFGNRHHMIDLMQRRIGIYACLQLEPAFGDMALFQRLCVVVGFV
jgi:hypothetical protein